MCDCEEFEDYEDMMSTNFEAKPEAEAQVQDPQPIPQVIVVKRK
ncbi:MAG: hypothetical protein OK455_05160 [Thaumarchaeota archaeon]|nr:hypothetical protein [Nitrososphaerota archaeon]